MPTGLVLGRDWGAGGIVRAMVARLAPGHTVVDLDCTGDVVDLVDPQDLRRAARLVVDRHDRCDVIVHRAGTFEHKSPEQRELDRAFDPA